MKLVRRLHFALAAELLLVMFSLVLIANEGEPTWTPGALFLLQIIFVVFTVFGVANPLKEFSEVLDAFIQKDRSEEELRSTAERVPFMGKVCQLIDKYAAIRTRKNSAEVFDKQTELTALQSQINPHFLYNTLESIRGQALMDDNLEIAKMVEALAAFFRYSISRKSNLVTLRDELANINNYMLIQRYRFNNRFSLEVFIDEEDEAAYDFLIPKLIIQPIVENAIFHGLEEMLEGGKVTIEVIVTEQNLIITISDNGKGIEREKLEKLNSRIRSSNIELEDENQGDQRNTGIALPNVNKRIHLLFGEEYGVNVYSTVGQGTDVEITIPANDQRDRDIGNEKGNFADQ